MSKQPKRETEFKLGITMAGAVTAGAYSAGCLYYLLRNLEQWEQEKKKPDNASIPKHKVTIEVMGGASAGSMVTAIAALTFGLKSEFTDIQDVDKEDPQYDAWVNLLDMEVEEGTLMELLRGHKKGSKGDEKFSLFDAGFLDRLRDKIIKKIIASDNERKWPVYISENLQILFTLTSLNGVPVGVSFSKDHPESPESPVHYMKSHQVITHYKRDPSGQDSDIFLKLPLLGEESSDVEQKEADMQKFVDYALASGAFPIGFPPKERNLPGKLLRHYLRNYFFKDFDKKLVLGKVVQASKFHFTAIDGGTLNNEPFVEVKNILNEIILDLDESTEETVQEEISGSPYWDSVSIEQQQSSSFRSFKASMEAEEKKEDVQVYDAIMMIDPFPNFTDIDIDTTSSNSPKEIIFNIIGALRGQAMVKNPDRLLDFINGERFGMIFPSRRLEGERVKHLPHLATSGVGAFGGFLSRDFREHDFVLGMKNCQSFIRRYFGINSSAKEQYGCFRDWHEGDERYQRFAYKDNRTGDEEVVRFPIIPDMALQHPNGNSDQQARFNNTDIKVPVFPSIKPEDVTRYARPLRRRLYYLGRKWLFSKSKRSKTDPQNVPGFVKPFKTANWLRKAIIFSLFLALVGYLYWLLPTASFWLMLIFLATAVVLAAYLAFRNAIANVFATLLKQLADRNQLDT